MPRFFSSPFITTVAQAGSAAASLLRKSLGLPYSIDLTAMANPALVPFDPVSVRSADSERAETHVLERLTIPLLAGAPMTGSTREQTIILLGTA